MSYVAKLYEKSGVKQIAVLLAVSALLASCGNINPDPVCVSNDEMGQTTGKTIKIDAYRGTNDNGDGDGWVNTGITVATGGKIKIEAIGEVALCSQSAQYDNPGTSNAALISGSVCPGKNGKFLEASFGDTAGSNIQKLSGCSKDSSAPSAPGTSTIPSLCSEGDTTCTCANGLFEKTISPQTGKLWLRIMDIATNSDNVAGNDGDAIYSKYIPSTVAVVTKTNASADNCNDLITGISSTSCFIQSAKVEKKPKCVDNTCAPDETVTCGSMIADSADGNCYVTGNVTTNVIKLAGETCASKIRSISGDARNCIIGSVFPKLSVETCASKASTSSTYSYCSVPISEKAGSNSGYYNVSVSTTKVVSSGFSNTVDVIVDPIKKLLFGVEADSAATPPVEEKIGMIKTMFNGIVKNSDFITAVRALVVLAVIFYGFYYMIGLGNTTQKELYYFILKMTIVLSLTGNYSWEFFSNYLLGLFIGGADSLMWMMSYNINELIGKANPTLIQLPATPSGAIQGKSVFTFINQTIALIFSQEANIKLQAILATFPIGPILFIVIWIGIIFFFFALFKGLLTYILSIIMVGVLLFMAPIFICFLMFKRTKSIFDKWIKTLASYALQPALLFVVLAVFNVFIMLSLYNILNFSACFTCIWEIDLPISEIIGYVIPGIPDFDKFCAIYGYLPWGVDATQTMAVKLAKTPMGLMYVLIFIILANSMVKFIDWVQQIANTLIGGKSSLSSGVNKAIGEATALGKGAAGIGLGATKFAVGNAAKFGDWATGHKISDGARKIARNVLPKLLTKGGGDGMGGKLQYSEGLMTHAERQGLKREKKAFDRAGEGRGGAMRQEKIMMRNQSSYDDARSEGSLDKARADRSKELAKLGSGGQFFGDKEGRSVSKEFIRRRMEGEEDLTLEGVNNERVKSRKDAAAEKKKRDTVSSERARDSLMAKIEASKKADAEKKDKEDRERAERFVDFAASLAKKADDGRFMTEDGSVSKKAVAFSAVRHLKVSDGMELKRLVDSKGEGSEGLRKHMASALVTKMLGDESMGVVSKEEREQVNRVATAAVDAAVKRDAESFRNLVQVSREAKDNPASQNVVNMALSIAGVDQRMIDGGGGQARQAQLALSESLSSLAANPEVARGALKGALGEQNAALVENLVVRAGGNEDVRGFLSAAAAAAQSPSADSAMDLADAAIRLRESGGAALINDVLRSEEAQSLGTQEFRNVLSASAALVDNPNMDSFQALSTSLANERLHQQMVVAAEAAAPGSVDVATQTVQEVRTVVQSTQAEGVVAAAKSLAGNQSVQDVAEAASQLARKPSLSNLARAAQAASKAANPEVTRGVVDVAGKASDLASKVKQGDDGTE